MNDQIKVPDFMPVLKRGRHMTPAEGACMMEYISVLAGERFSDHPRCVHPQLAHMARAVNDYMGDSDADRALLLPLLHRFMGTGDLLPPHIADQVSEALGEFESDASWRNAHLALATPDERVALLTKAVDTYDRITGRRCPDPISEEQHQAAGKRMTQVRLPMTFDETHEWVQKAMTQWSTLSGATVTWGTPASKVNSELLAMYAGQKVVAL